MTTNDFTQPETFETADVAAAIKSTLLSLGCMLLLLGFLVWFLIGAVMGMLGVPAPALVALLPVAAVIGLILWLKVIQIKKQMADTKVVVDAYGIAQHDGRHVIRKLAWADIEKADLVQPVLQMQKIQAGTAQSKAAGEAAGGAAAAVGRALGSSVGLVGPGSYDFLDSRRMIQASYLQTFGSTPDGIPMVGITPNLAGVNWTEERLGEWVGHYRPEILEQVRALEMQYKVKKADPVN